ncbi:MULTISPECIES: DUF3465 domain-containing protein [Bombella]|uniref:DUF3465 domain-containing protein n=1 Tax=Bombella pollinis TaxID=2967337 RepID=A0ABT3WR17_9PROT|nr:MULTISPECIES: DUF3465 domain-containing protein [Bombella]MCT6854971.1 DUF3465 domain-containing protein [Bombella apis]MCX5620098.1 DUF3465 domain-containing protein [Bombella pollinis]
MMRFSWSMMVRAGLLGLLASGVGLVPARAETAIEATMPAQCDNQRFVQDQAHYNQQFAHKQIPYGQHLDMPEHICGTVVHVYRARQSRSGQHGYFLMSVAGGTPLRIVSNLDEMRAPAWPWVKVGDHVEVQGRYYYDGPSRQGLDWTHHGTSRQWPWPGFVSVNGQRYQ